MIRYLPREIGTEVFEGQAAIGRLTSSYKDHGYGHFLYALVRQLKPERCVEMGVLQGYSLLSIASALRDNQAGSIRGYDLFEQYPFRSEPLANVEGRIGSCGLRNWAEVIRADADNIDAGTKRLDLLHVDLSNCGSTYRRVFARYEPLVDGVILLEGGSVCRDQVEWMGKFGKERIAPVVRELRNRYPQWTIAVLEPYPSMTVAVRQTAAARRTGP